MLLVLVLGDKIVDGASGWVPDPEPDPGVPSSEFWVEAEPEVSSDAELEDPNISD